VRRCTSNPQRQRQRRAETETEGAGAVQRSTRPGTRGQCYGLLAVFVLLVVVVDDSIWASCSAGQGLFSPATVIGARSVELPDTPLRGAWAVAEGDKLAAVLVYGLGPGQGT